MLNWETVAIKVESEYETMVDWDERFFICPECGEPIYECDYSEYDEFACPICEEEL